MAQIYRHVLRLHDTGQHMQNVKALRQSHKILKICERPRAFASFYVSGVRCSRNGKKGDIPSAKSNVPAWRSSNKNNCPGSCRYSAFNKAPIELDYHRIFVRAGSCRLQSGPASFVKHANAYLFENTQRILVNGFDLIVGENTHRFEWIHQSPVVHGTIMRARAYSSPTSGILFGCNHGNPASQGI